LGGEGASQPVKASDIQLALPESASRTTTLIATQASSAVLDRLWPSRELSHQLGVMHRDAKTFSNVPVSSIEQACEKAQWHLKKGADVYFGCAEFSTNGTRKADNAVSASAFWLDIDCGQDKAAAGKGYLDVAEAQVAVSNFCGEAELPEPTHLVNSGGGLHAYWALSSAVDAQEWIALARQFKDLTQRLCLMADPSRTADIAIGGGVSIN
jgi:hypothetical protein